MRRGTAPAQDRPVRVADLVAASDTGPAISRRRWRRPALIAVAVVVAMLAAGGGTVAALAKTVSISVDGQQQQVTTLASTVDGALAAAGVRVGAHDTQAPAGATALSDGSRVVIQRGRLLQVTLDGVQRKWWTTATTVDAALAELGRDPAGLKLSADRFRSIPLTGLTLTADTLRTITLTDRSAAPRQISSTTSTVADLLAQQGITLGPSDRVSPPVGTPITDGLAVSIVTLPTVKVVADGVATSLTTDAATVGDLLASRHITPTDKVRVSLTSDTPLAQGLQITVTTLPTVTLTDGARAATPVISDLPTVADLLRSRKITVGASDSLSPKPSTRLSEGLKVVITRVSYRTTTKVEEIPQPADRRIHTESLNIGTTTISHGHPGKQEITYRTTTTNGKASPPKEISRTTVQEPAATVIRVGTHQNPPPPAPTPAPAPAPAPAAGPPPSAAGVTWVGGQVFFHDLTYGVNWDGLANCESTHNPKAVNAHPSRGLPTYGLFQFDLPTWRSVGGSGNPVDASPQEQLTRAKMLYQARGLGPWACAWAAR